MRNRPCSRTAALLLLAVFLASGGLRALDVALYHHDGSAGRSGIARVSGTDAPRLHADQCVLGQDLRSASDLALAPVVLAIRAALVSGTPALRASAPRPRTASTTPARAPPHIA